MISSLDIISNLTKHPCFTTSETLADILGNHANVSEAKQGCFVK